MGAGSESGSSLRGFVRVLSQFLLPFKCLFVSEVREEEEGERQEGLEKDVIISITRHHKLSSCARVEKESRGKSS